MPSQKNVTSYDVAALAGVAQSTVSRVLGSSDPSQFISEETIERVRKAAEQLGYSPNPLARALRGERTHMIGLVVREIGDPFFSGFIEVLSNEAREYDYHVILGHVHSDPHEGLQMARVLDSRQCDGMIFLGDLRNDDEVLRTLIREKHPVVALCRGKKVANIPTVNCNNEIGIRLLIDHLISLGHTDLAFIDGGWLGDISERRDAFLQYMANRSKEKYTWIQSEKDDFFCGYQSMFTLINRTPRPTAVLTSDDTMAVGAIRAANEAHLRVPEDISITGFDDIELSQYTIPSLTTVRQPIEAMAKIAIRNVIAQIEKKSLSDEDSFIQMVPELIIRNSSGPAPK